MSIHHAAEGYDTQATADTYARGRPDYPAALDAWLRDTLGLHTGSTVLDLGAGTGKFTPRLLATGARVVAVEPVQAMRDKLHATYGHVQVLDGRADAIPLPDASLDVVVCAQSFHWFATPDALAEIRRVLKPGGRLGLVWNMRDNSVPWVARLDALVNQLRRRHAALLHRCLARGIPQCRFRPAGRSAFQQRSHRQPRHGHPRPRAFHQLHRRASRCPARSGGCPIARIDRQ